MTLRFDPTTTAVINDTLRIVSNDPVNPTSSVSLTGEGHLPQVTVAAPGQNIYASASQAYTINWAGQYAPGDGVYSIYYDTDRNPASGLVPIVSGLTQSTTA